MINEKDMMQTLEKLGSIKQSIMNEIGKVIIGQEEVIEQFLIVLLSNGHALLEGVPGLAKTLLVSTIAQVLNLQFNRIQFTPDLMPSDITGTDILTENRSDGKKSFEYIKGPIFANLVLTDEINRTPPKTQSALLQAMQEYQVTAGNTTYKLPQPFMVLATQNPIEQEGTYPLPEAQLDRFMFNIHINYPSFEEEKRIVDTTTSENNVVINSMLSVDDLLNIQKSIRNIPVSDHVIDYAVRLARATRPNNPEAPEFINQLVTWGAGPRASQYLILAAKARAALNKKLTPSIDDVRKNAIITLQHRVLISFAAQAEGIKAKDIVVRLLQEIKE